MSNFFFVPVVNHTVGWWNFMTFLAFFSIFLFVALVEILANYSLFRKFGDIEPWKGLIPIYSTFLLYRRYYGSGLFIHLVFIWINVQNGKIVWKRHILVYILNGFTKSNRGANLSIWNIKI